MMEALFKQYLLVYASSAVKFILGPLLATTMRLSVVETVLLTVSGMMTTVVILTFLGIGLRKRLLAKFGKKRRLFTPANRRIVRVWSLYGAIGVAFLTPLLFSPPIGTLIVVSFGEKRLKILTFMLLSATFWALLFALAGEQIFAALRALGVLS